MLADVARGEVDPDEDSGEKAETGQADQMERDFQDRASPGLSFVA
jgi:hypothetical protein